MAAKKKRKSPGAGKEGVITRAKPGSQTPQRVIESLVAGCEGAAFAPVGAAPCAAMGCALTVMDLRFTKGFAKPLRSIKIRRRLRGIWDEAIEQCVEIPPSMKKTLEVPPLLRVRGVVKPAPRSRSARIGSPVAATRAASLGMVRTRRLHI